MDEIQYFFYISFYKFFSLDIIFDNNNKKYNNLRE